MILPWIIAISTWITFWLVALVALSKETKRKKWAENALLISGTTTLLSGLVVLIDLYVFRFWNSALWALACGIILVLFGQLLLVKYRRLNSRGYD